MNSDNIQVATLAVAMWISLVLFYRSFEVEWPDRYFDGLRGVDPLVSRTSGRYFVFRVAPFFLAALVVGAAAMRLEISVEAAVWIGTTLYVGTGPLFRAGVAWVRKPRRLGSAVHRLFTASLLVATAAAAVVVADDVEPYVPSLRETVLAAWVALFIFLFGRLGLLATTIQRPSDDALIARALDEMQPEHIETLMSADPSGAFLTVAVVEQLNRPRWVRRLENLMPGELTRGVMQVRSRTPISDDESIRRFLSSHARMMGAEDWSDSRRNTFFIRHNPTPEFVDFAERIYWNVQWEGTRRTE